MSDNENNLPEEEETPTETFDFSAILLKLKEGFSAKRLAPGWKHDKIKAFLPEPGSEDVPFLHFEDDIEVEFEPDQEDLFATDWVLA